jgi:hypothetical protein
MLGHGRKFVVAVLLVVLGGVSADDTPSGNPSLIGIDHIPTVVADLEEASDSYRRIGFSLKPGRPHENGLRNNHVKFKDGSGIELISVPAIPADEMTRSYSELLRGGEGPAYISFHARDTDALVAALNAARIRFGNDNGLITLGDPHLSFVFFVRDNRSPTDKPEHFAHSNGAIAMTEVWLALDAPALESLRKLLLSLGSVERTETVALPASALAHVFYLQNGRVVAVSKDHQLIAGREIIGATFRVFSGQAKNGGTGLADTMVEPSVAHGLWLHLAREP